MIDLSQRCTLLEGDCLEKMKELPDESISLVLTDPPYGLVSTTAKSSSGFMGKQWDSKFPEVPVWKEILRVMKSGAFCVFTMSPRQDCLLDCLQTLKESDFNLGFSQMQWLYHSGFPKAGDISKAIDKRQGLKGKVVGKSNRGVGNTADSSYVKNKILSREEHTGTGVGYLDGNGKEFDIIEPESEQAKQWAGWKSCSLKPSVEIIVVVQKPRSEKTIVEQVLKNGCGAVNVESCRIPYANENDMEENRREQKYGSTTTFSAGKPLGDYINVKGRFPANLLVSGNPLLGEESKSGGVGGRAEHGRGEGYGFKPLKENAPEIPQDFGSPNRFYDLDRWAEKRGITLTEDSAFFDVPKPASSEKEGGLDNFEEKTTFDFGSIKKSEGRHGENTKRKNIHPTTKPVLLFCYLAELFCQPNGLILDPFMGSGTTGISALKMNKRFVGIEKELSYFEIAQARIKPFLEQQKLVIK